jgi:triosephosphate isomerase
MRKPLVAGNWKMFKTIAEARSLVSDLIPALQEIENVDKAVCPPFTALLPVAALLGGTDIGLGAQNMFWESSGAYTGEISPAMLAELCQYVIIGHSERRTYFGETDETVNRKIKAAFANSLTPIVCIGETLEQNEAGKTEKVVAGQLQKGLVGLDGYLKNGNAGSLIIAYEPIWAIGTGRAATSSGAVGVIRDFIRPVLGEIFDPAAAQEIRVLYGGSVKANNALEYFTEVEIDGALVGGASLKVDEFSRIVKAAESS